MLSNPSPILESQISALSKEAIVQYLVSVERKSGTMQSYSSSSSDEMIGSTNIAFWPHVGSVFPVGIKIDETSINRKFNYSKIVGDENIQFEPVSKISDIMKIYKVVQINGKYNTAKLYYDGTTSLSELSNGSEEEIKNKWNSFENKYLPTTTIDGNNIKTETYYFVSVMQPKFNYTIDAFLNNRKRDITVHDKKLKGNITVSYPQVYKSTSAAFTKTTELVVAKANAKASFLRIINKKFHVRQLTTPLASGAANLPMNPNMVQDQNRLSLDGVDGVPANSNGGGMDGGGKPRLSISSLRYLSKY